LELGLEQAAQAAVRGGTADFLWEEEDADGVIEGRNDRTAHDADDDDSWLETQGETVIGDGEPATETSAGPEHVSPPEEPEDATPIEEPEDVSPTDEPEDVSPTDEPEDVSPPEEPEDATPIEEPEDVSPPEEPEDVSPPEEPEDVSQQGASDEPSPADASPGDEQAREIDVEQVLDLADSLRKTGARLFFHVQEESSGQTKQKTGAKHQPDEEPVDPPSEDASSNDVTPETAAARAEEEASGSGAQIDVEDCVPDRSPMAASPEPSDRFVEQFERFLDGKLNNDEIITLAAKALERKNNEEARELLHFTPRNENEELARKRHLVDYYLAVEQPSTALEIIESLQTDPLPENDRRELMIKQASCHNKLNDFENAQAIYKKIAKEFPSDDIEAMAKRNDERIKQSQSGEALVLEKTTSLQDE
jgi:hypothetical protein